MRVSRVLSPVTALGPGRRVGLWVQGCDLACPGCASTDTWSPEGGLEMAVNDVAARIAALAHAEGLTGLTVSGGEPFQQADEVAAVIEQVRRDCPGIDVLIFTGYPASVAQKRSPSLFESADVVVAGRYDRTLPPGGPLVASANQQVHFVTDPGRERWTDDAVGSDLQVAADEEGLSIIGLPRAGDLDRLVEKLALAGIVLDDLTWRQQL